MSESTNHISLERLQRFAIGQLDADASTEIADHLETCATCAAAFAEISLSHDPFVRNLQRMAQAPGTPPSADVQSADDETYLHRPVTPNEDTRHLDAGTHRTSRSPAIPVVEDAGKRFGDYEILEEIARGGMGVVFKARQVKAGRIVALKMILSGQLADNDEVQRFYGEAQSAAQLDHPNIVPVFDVGEHEGQHYFSMGFVQGRTLKQIVNEGPLAPDRAARFVQLIGEAIAYAHSRGVVHRDLKSANVLVDQDDNPRVTDFGLAKVLDSTSQLTVSGQIVGTPSYMPPEQAAGKTADVGPLSDVYSLGAILYELVTGRPPFQAASVLDVLNAVLTQEPIRPRTLSPAISQDLETICLKCLEKSPERRYQSAQELVDELGRFLRHEPIRARPVGALERGWRWCRRHQSVAILAAGLLASLVMGIVTTSYFAIQMRLRAIEANLSANREREARRLAQREQFTALVNKARLEIATAAEPGWSWSAQKDLGKAAALDVSHDPAVLRALATQTLMSLDVRRIGSITAETLISDLCFSPDGKKLFVAERKRGLVMRVLLHDMETRELVATYNYTTTSDNLQRLAGRVLQSFAAKRDADIQFQEGARVIACSSDGRWLAVGTRYGKILVWPVAEPTSAPQVIEAYDSEVMRLVFSPDSRRLYSSDRAQPRSRPGVSTWRLESREWVREKLLDGVGYDFRLSPDGTRLAVMSDRYRLFDTTNWTSLDVEATGRGVGPAFSHDGNFLACERNATLVLQDAFTCEVVGQVRDPEYGNEFQGDQIQFLGDTYHAVVSDPQHEGVRILDLLRGRRVANLPTWGERGAQFCVSADGRRLAVFESRRIGLYEARYPAQCHAPPLPKPSVVKLAFSGDGERLAVLRSGDETNHISQTVTDILLTRPSQALVLEQRLRVTQNVTPTTGSTPTRPGGIALNRRGDRIAISEPLLGLQIRDVGGELRVPAKMPARVPSQLAVTMAQLSPDGVANASHSRYSYEMEAVPDDVSADIYGVYVDLRRFCDRRGSDRGMISVAWNDLSSDYRVHPRDTSFTAVAAIINGEDLRGKRATLHVDDGAFSSVGWRLVELRKLVESGPCAARVTIENVEYELDAQGKILRGTEKEHIGGLRNDSQDMFVMIAASTQGLVALHASGEVYRFLGTPHEWAPLWGKVADSPAAAIAAVGPRLYVLTRDNRCFQLGDMPHEWTPVLDFDGTRPVPEIPSRLQAAFVPKFQRPNDPRLQTFISGPVSLSPDGETLWAVVDGDHLGCWSVTDNRLLYSFSNSAQTLLSGKSRIRAIAGGRSLVVAACEPDLVYIFDSSSGKVRHRWSLAGQEINSVQVYGSDRFILYGTNAGLVGTMDISTGQVTVRHHADAPVIAVGVAPDEARMLYASADGALASWRSESDANWSVDFQLRVTAGTLTDAVISQSHLAYHVQGEPAPIVVDLRSALRALRDLRL